MVAQRITGEKKATEAFNEAPGRTWEGYAYEKGRESIPRSDPIRVLVKDGAIGVPVGYETMQPAWVIGWNLRRGRPPRR